MQVKYISDVYNTILNISQLLFSVYYEFNRKYFQLFDKILALGEFYV